MSLFFSTVGRQFEPYRWRPGVTWDVIPEQSYLRLFYTTLRILIDREFIIAQT